LVKRQNQWHTLDFSLEIGHQQQQQRHILREGTTKLQMEQAENIFDHNKACLVAWPQ